MPRVVTTSRYVTTLRFMAYLTGTQVTSSARGYRQKKAASSDARPRNAPLRNPRTWRLDTWHERCLPLEEEDTRIYAFDETWRNVMGSENRVVHLEIYGWLVLQCSKETERGLCRRRNAIWFFTYTKASRVCAKQTKTLYGKIQDFESTKWAEMQFYMYNNNIYLYFCTWRI